MKELNAIRKAVEMGFEVTSFAIGEIAVESRGDGAWAVLDGRWCLNRDGKWEHEPLSSNRTEEFLARCRFPLEEAVSLAAAAHEASRR